MKKISKFNEEKSIFNTKNMFEEIRRTLSIGILK